MPWGTPHKKKVWSSSLWSDFSQFWLIILLTFCWPHNTYMQWQGQWALMLSHHTYNLCPRGSPVPYKPGTLSRKLSHFAVAVILLVKVSLSTAASRTPGFLSCWWGCWCSVCTVYPLWFLCTEWDFAITSSFILPSVNIGISGPGY